MYVIYMQYYTRKKNIYTWTYFIHEQFFPGNKSNRNVNMNAETTVSNYSKTS